MPATLPASAESEACLEGLQGQGTIWTVPCICLAVSPPIPRPDPSKFVLTLDPAVSVPARQLPCLSIPLHHPTGTEQYQSQPCPAGHFCPAGTRSPRPCPVGTFRSRRQAGAAAECLPCPADTFGALPGQTGCLPCGSFAFSPQGGSHPCLPPTGPPPLSPGTEPQGTRAPGPCNREGQRCRVAENGLIVQSSCLDVREWTSLQARCPRGVCVCVCARSRATFNSLTSRLQGFYHYFLSAR